VHADDLLAADFGEAEVGVGDCEQTHILKLGVIGGGQLNQRSIGYMITIVDI